MFNYLKEFQASRGRFENAKFQQQSTRDQIPKRGPDILMLGAWSLELLWSLVFGVWCFRRWGAVPA
jgi:hypothetical protein